MRKVYINVMCRIIINADEGIAVSDIMDELDYSFISTNDGADVVDTEMLDYEVVDSK
jgi:hypothetical protein